MKKIFAAVLFLCFFFSFSIATAKGGELTVHGYLDAGWVSQYVGGLGGGTAIDKNAFQQSLTFMLKPVGLYVCGWNSYSPDGGFNSDYGDEYDIFVGIKRNFRNFKFDLGYGFYNMYDLRNTQGDLHGFYFKTEFPNVLGAIPYLWLEKDVSSSDDSGGHYYRAGLVYTMKVIKQPIDFNLSLAGHDGAFGRRSEPLSSGKLAVSANFSIWKFTVTPQINFQQRGWDIKLKMAEIPKAKFGMA